MKMNTNNELKQVLENKDFVERIVKMETPEEVQKAFAEKGVEISKEEVQALGYIINKVCEKKSTVLSQEDLNEIAGGHDGLMDDFLSGLFLSPVGAAAPIIAGSQDTSKSLTNKFAIAAGTATSTAVVGVAAIGAYEGVKWAYNKYKGRK